MGFVGNGDEVGLAECADDESRNPDILDSEARMGFEEVADHVANHNAQRLRVRVEPTSMNLGENWTIW